MEEIKGKIDKADIINVSAIVGLAVFVALVAVNLFFVSKAENPADAIKEVIPWVMTTVSSIFLAYGITKKNSSE